MTGEDPVAVHGADEVALALEQLQADKKTPAFVKILFNHMLTVQQQLNLVLTKNQELQEQVANLREENGALKAALAEAGRVSSAAQFLPRDSFAASNLSAVDEKERLRSVVISGITESIDSRSTERAIHDFNSVRNVLDHLNVECVPQLTYRLGKPQEGRPRLLKVVLPNTFYQSLVLRRASWLRSFSCRGVYIRPSLTKEERERNREARLARRASLGVTVTNNQPTQLDISTGNC